MVGCKLATLIQKYILPCVNCLGWWWTVDGVGNVFLVDLIIASWILKKEDSKTKLWTGTKVKLDKSDKPEEISGVRKMVTQQIKPYS